MILDYDAIGAAIGVAKMSLDLNKETYIVTSGQGPSLAKLETVSEDQAKLYLNLVVNEEEALKLATEKYGDEWVCNVTINNVEELEEINVLTKVGKNIILVEDGRFVTEGKKMPDGSFEK